MSGFRFHFRRVRQSLLLPVIGLRDHVMFSDRAAFSRGAWPVVNQSSTPSDPPFFVLGSPRSGTTLLRAMLCAHPQLVIPPENGAWIGMIRAFGSMRRAPWPKVVDAVLEAFAQGYEFEYWRLDLDELRSRACALVEEDRSLSELFEVIYRCYAETTAPQAMRWGDKSTPGDFHVLGKLAMIFPQARYVSVVRDGRDCVASSVQAGFFESSFKHAAYAWRDNVRFCRRFGINRLGPDRFYEFRYEDLVAQPQRQMEQICSFLKIEPHEAMLAHNPQESTLAHDITAIGHHGNVKRPLSSKSIGRWRSGIPEEHIPLVQRILRSELTHYGYQI